MKEKRYFYECVVPVEMGYMAQDQRRERWLPNEPPPECLHSLRFFPKDPVAEVGKKGFYPDYIVTDKPLHPRYTDEIPKVVNRKNMRTGDREDIRTTSKIKWVLVEEVSEYIRTHARHMILRDIDYAEPVALGRPPGKTA